MAEQSLSNVYNKQHFNLLCELYEGNLQLKGLAFNSMVL